MSVRLLLWLIWPCAFGIAWTMTASIKTNRAAFLATWGAIIFALILIIFDAPWYPGNTGIYNPDAMPHARHLSADQILCITGSFKNESHFPTLRLFNTPDSNSTDYAIEFERAFRNAGFHDIRPELTAARSGERGVMVGLADVDNPSPQAKEFVRILEGKCHIVLHFTKFENAPTKDAFDLFIAPPPR